MCNAMPPLGSAAYGELLASNYMRIVEYASAWLVINPVWYGLVDVESRCGRVFLAVRHPRHMQPPGRVGLIVPGLLCLDCLSRCGPNVHRLLDHLSMLALIGYGAPHDGCRDAYMTLEPTGTEWKMELTVHAPAGLN